MNRICALLVIVVYTMAKPYFVSKTIIIPHDEKKHRGGEDAAENDESILVVADGVGGWGLQGVNPGLFSNLLVKNVVSRNKEHPTEHIRSLVY